MDRILLLICAVTPLTRSKVGNYFIPDQVVSWADGQVLCESYQGGEYASLHSNANLDEVEDLCEALEAEEKCHIGMKLVGAFWVWVDGTTPDWGFLANGEPNGINPPWKNAAAFDPVQNAEYCQYIDLIGAGEGVFDDTNCDEQHHPVCYLCNEIGIDDICKTDDDCFQPCQRCCGKNKICECRPGYDCGEGVPAKRSSVQGVLGDMNDASKVIHVKDTNYSYYGYIILVGVIAFILINNIFVGCWCLRKGGEDYKKVDMIANEI